MEFIPYFITAAFAVMLVTMFNMYSRIQNLESAMDEVDRDLDQMDMDLDRDFDNLGMRPGS